MNIIFISNYFNHHQKELSEALYRLTGHSYTFVSTTEMRDERKKLGYGQTSSPQYVVDVFHNPEKEKYVQKIMLSSNVTIIGSCDNKNFKSISKKLPLVFRYSERPLKQGIQPMKYIPRFIKWHLDNPRKAPIYLLCASAYTSADYARFGLFRKRAYKWGYFPETKRYEDIDTLILRKNKKRILWCGRFLDWKHPLDAIMVAKMLKYNNYQFTLDFIGAGPMEQAMKNAVDEHDLSDCVHFLGTMPPAEVRKEMEKAGICLLTSDKNEGWGAVLNEAMNSACAVVASHAIGASPFLLKQEVNGNIYASGDVQELYYHVSNLLENQEKQELYGKLAYETIVDEWNAEIAAKRLITLSQHIIDGEKFPILYKTGPCSPADKLKDDWYKNVKKNN